MLCGKATSCFVSGQSASNTSPLCFAFCGPFKPFTCRFVDVQKRDVRVNVVSRHTSANTRG